MKKLHIKGKLTLEKMNIAKLNNLSSIRGGSMIQIGFGDGINNMDDDNDDDGDGDLTIPTWPNTAHGG